MQAAELLGTREFRLLGPAGMHAATPSWTYKLPNVMALIPRKGMWAIVLCWALWKSYKASSGEVLVIGPINQI